MANPSTPLPRFYVASSEPPGAANACACGYFLNKQDKNLVLGRKDQLDIFGFTSEGLKVLATTRLSHAIHTLVPIRPHWAKSDLVFVLLQNLEVLLLEFRLNSEKRPVMLTRAGGSVADKVGRLTETGFLVSVDPNNACIALHIYESLVRIIPLNKELSDTKELETFSIRIDENYVRSIVFLHNADVPTMAMLHKDASGTHIVSYEVDFKEKELKKPENGRVEYKNIEADMQALLAVPGTNKGVVGCGFNMLLYVDADGGNSTTSEIRKDNRGMGVVYSVISDSDAAMKILMADYTGMLHVIRLKKAPSSKQNRLRVAELNVITLGRLVMASCAAYLDNRVLFIGSRMADSTVIRFREDPHPETGNLFDVLETITNIGCITDFTIVRSEAQGTQPQMIACSGYGPGTSARIIRSGIGVQETTSLDAPTGRQIFGVNTLTAEEGPHDVLVVSFLNETRVLRIEQDVGDFEDVESMGAFALNDATLLVRNIAGHIVQITRKSVRAIEPGTLQLKGEWFPPEGSQQIGSAASYRNQIVVGAFDTLMVFTFTNADSAPVIQQVKMGGQISAIDIVSFSNGDLADYVAVATWNMDVVLLSAPDWSLSLTIDLNTDVFARSLMFYQLDANDFIIAGLGDGSLQYFTLERGKAAVSPGKRVNVGTQPTYLKPFIARGQKSVFVCNDRPSVIHGSGGKLIFSSVNMKHVYSVCQVDSPVYPSNLAIITETGVVLGKIDEIQKLHIRSVALPGTARRVVYQAETGTYGFVVMDKPTSVDVSAGGDATMQDDLMEEDEDPMGLSAELPAHKFIVTDHTNYQIMTQFNFQRYEAVQALASGNLGTDPRPFFVVGTGIGKPDEKDITNGRIIVFHYAEKNLQIVHEKSVNAFVTSLLIFKDKLLVTCGSSVKLMRWTEDGSDLVLEQSVNRFIMPTGLKVKGDFVLVVDLMRSVTLMLYRGAENKFDVIAADPIPRWPTDCEFLDDDSCVVTDTYSNLIFLRRDVDAKDTERKDMVEIAGANFADITNVVRKGTLLGESTVNERHFAQNALILGTQSGSIMHVLTIDENTFIILKQLSDRMVKSIMPFGRVLADKYNAIQTSTGSTKPSHGVINGDLIEMFGSMHSQEMQEAVDGIKDRNGAMVNVETVARLVEDLSRSH